MAFGGVDLEGKGITGCVFTAVLKDLLKAWIGHDLCRGLIKRLNDNS